MASNGGIVIVVGAGVDVAGASTTPTAVSA